MAKQQTVKITPKEVKRSKETWASFTSLMKWCIISVCVTLILMVAIFIR